jgi:hypothetical protein
VRASSAKRLPRPCGASGVPPCEHVRPQTVSADDTLVGYSEQTPMEAPLGKPEVIFHVSIPGENGAGLRFRSEFFNIFNPNFCSPNNTLNSPRFGHSTQMLASSLAGLTNSGFKGGASGAGLVESPYCLAANRGLPKKHHLAHSFIQCSKRSIRSGNRRIKKEERWQRKAVRRRPQRISNR